MCKIRLPLECVRRIASGGRAPSDCRRWRRRTVRTRGSSPSTQVPPLHPYGIPADDRKPTDFHRAARDPTRSRECRSATSRSPHLSPKSPLRSSLSFNVSLYHTRSALIGLPSRSIAPSATMIMFSRLPASGRVRGVKERRHARNR